jgi:MoaA/NifB/PqqE/SkfB family radical SAM enzyme
MKRQRTVEWQVCGVCNYDCSYCIQSKKTRVGHPSDDEVTRFLDFFAELDLAGPWEVKTTGGEPFAFKGFLERIVPGLVERTRHTLSTLTNLSAPVKQLDRFAELTRGRLGIVSASIHLEHVDLDDFVAKALHFRKRMDPSGRFVVNAVLVPGQLEQVERARDAIEDAGIRFFPQIMKVKGGTYDYDAPDAKRLLRWLGDAPTPSEANVAPSYKGRLCWTGVDYFVLTQTGDAWSCRTARRESTGYMGNVLGHGDQPFARFAGPRPCAFDICPCTVPANRGMIEGVP